MLVIVACVYVCMCTYMSVVNMGPPASAQPRTDHTASSLFRSRSWAASHPFLNTHPNFLSLGSLYSKRTLCPLVACHYLLKYMEAFSKHHLLSISSPYSAPSSPNSRPCASPRFHHRGLGVSVSSCVPLSITWKSPKGRVWAISGSLQLGTRLGTGGTM